MNENQNLQPMKPLPNLIFMSRWLQLPLYLGLILAQAVYVYQFWAELYYLIMSAFGNQEALKHILEAVAVEVGPDIITNGSERRNVARVDGWIVLTSSERH